MLASANEDKSDILLLIWAVYLKACLKFEQWFAVNSFLSCSKYMLMKKYKSNAYSKGSQTKWWMVNMYCNQGS